jgi:hypothetical protein
MRLYHNNPAFAHCLDFVERKERILVMMSDVMEQALDQKLGEQEHLTAFELTDKELERVDGGQWWGGGTAINQAALANPGFFGGTALNQAAIANPGLFGGTALNQAALANRGFGGTALNQAAIS